LNEEAPATLLVIDRSSLNPAHRGQESGRAQVNQGVFVLVTGHEREWIFARRAVELGTSLDLPPGSRNAEWDLLLCITLHLPRRYENNQTALWIFL